ncbi:MAG: HPP family protein [Rhodocyclales bacterium]|nr:HPP family protein [Rhodocyclales bacterium]
MRLDFLASMLFPEQAAVSGREKVISALAACIAIAAVIWASQQLAQSEHRPFVIASMGSSAVLLFAVFHSPLSQPWALVGGHLASAAIGVLCAHHIPNPIVAAAAALGFAMLAMHWLRCLHPPAGATAVFAVIGGQPIQALGWGYVFSVVGANVAVLLLAALALNNLLPGRRYPMQRPGPATDTPLGRVSRPEHEDIVAALKGMDTFIDVAEEDLDRIYLLATINRQKRNLGSVFCRDIMTRNVTSVSPQTSLSAAWEVLRQRNIRGVPVLDEDRRVVGMVAISDFLKNTDWDWNRRSRLRCLLTSPRKAPATAADIMTSPVVTLHEDTHAAELFATFAGHGINHVPVTDAAGRLTGIITRLDLLNLFGDPLRAHGTASSQTLFSKA